MTSSHDNSLDDIFGSSPPHEKERIPHESSVGVPEPSDLPSLRRQHVTAGYRDGISTSKGQHVQNGFDAGFPVGAQLGMRVGTILGIIEGALRGYEGGASSGVVKKLPQRGAAGASSSNSKETEEARRAKREQLLKLYQRAVKELDVQAVFAGLGDTLGGGQSGEEKPEIQLQRKGNAVVSEWEKKVNVALWEENMEALEAKNEDGHEQDEPMTAERS